MTSTASGDTLPALRDLARLHAPLALEEERELILRAKAGDAAARDALVRGHMRLVVATVRKLRRMADEDLIAEGVLGLLEALDRFDTSYGVRLSTYAAPWIRVHAQRHLLTQRRIVSAPDTRAARRVLAQIGRVERHLIATTGSASAEAIAETIGVGEHDVAEVMVAMRSYDVPVGQREDGAAHHDPCDGCPSPEDECAEQEERLQLQLALRRAIAQLPDREREIVQARRLDEDKPVTLGQLAESMSLSSERVRQLEMRALRRLEHDLAHVAA